MEPPRQATRIALFDFTSVPMRTFHMAWSAFFLCSFGWFGIAPLMAVVRDDLELTRAQVGNTVIASVAITVLARLVVGWLCDRIGPRKAFTGLLVLGALPVMGIGLARDYGTFLLFRLAIGAIGASFVITQYHTTQMFAPDVVGTANATTAGWGNLGGGVTQMAMPAALAGLVALGFTTAESWRIAMILPGAALLAAGVAYWCATTDSPAGNYADLRAAGLMPGARQIDGHFWEAWKDRRVWALFVIYGACFGIELTINNVAALYFRDYFSLGLATSGLVAGLFGLMSIFARTLGGLVGDRSGRRWGLKGRVVCLGAVLLAEGLALMWFSRQQDLVMATVTLVVCGLFVKMSQGTTFSVVPFINRRALGAVAGIVGAGGNAGAVAAGLLFRTESLSWPQALLILGAVVTVSSVLAVTVRFSAAEERAAREETVGRPRRAREPADGALPAPQIS